MEIKFNGSRITTKTEREMEEAIKRCEAAIKRR